MVKGVTKRIVEIKDTGSGYFERAIFFVRMDCAKNAAEYTLAQEAARIVSQFSDDLKLGRPSKSLRIKSLLKMTASAAVGAAVTLLVLKLRVAF